MNLSLLVIDMQNGFCEVDGSYHQFGFDINNYREIIPNIKKIIDYFRKNNLPIIYSKAVREPSGIDCLDRLHSILPKERRERIKKIPLCIRGTWDSEVVQELKPLDEDYIVEKRRDSVFQDTELELWLKSLEVDTIVFSGIDTYLCVEGTIRDAFNKGYDVILVSDCVSSRNQAFHETTIRKVEKAYGIIVTSGELIEFVESVKNNTLEWSRWRDNLILSGEEF